MPPTQKGFTVVEVYDPAEMDERSSMSQRLPGRHKVHAYMLRDSTLRRSRPSRLPLTRHADRTLGDLQFGLVSERFGTEIRIIAPGMPAYCFSQVRTGRFAMSTPDTRGTTVEAGPGQGVIQRGLAGTRALSADGTARTGIWIASVRLEAALQACLGERLHSPIVFMPQLDWTNGAGAGLRRLVLHLAAELSQPGAGLATNAPALAAFTDLFVHTALQGLAHNYTESLAQQRDDAVPARVRRAEAYFREHADQVVRMEDVAAAAGCTVRALQRAFHQIREMTPHAALVRVRLELARGALTRDEASAVSVAQRYGFSNAGRFAAAYANRFGELPSETRRRSAQRLDYGDAEG